MVSRIRSCFPAASGGWARAYPVYAVPARGEAFSLNFEKDSCRSGSRGARREPRARTGGRRVVRERGRREGLLRVRTAMCLRGALSRKPPRARSHGLKNALGLECASVLSLVGAPRVRGEAEGSSLRGRGEHRGLRGGGGRDAKCRASAPTACGISLACGRLVVGTGPRSDGGPHTPERARGENTGIARRRWSRREPSCVGHRCGIPPLARASRRPVGNGKPRSVEARKPAVRAPSSRRRLTVYRRSLSLGTQRAPGRTHTRARVGGS